MALPKAGGKQPLVERIGPAAIQQKSVQMTLRAPVKADQVERGLICFESRLRGSMAPPGVGPAILLGSAVPPELSTSPNVSSGRSLFPGNATAAQQWIDDDQPPW